MNDLIHRIEAWMMAAGLLFFRSLPLDAASAVGGWLGRTVGPFFSAHRTARQNLAAAFPEKTEAERERILAGMWDNLGRVVAELAFLPDASILGRIRIAGGLEHMPGTTSGAFFFSGHLGNWELLASLATAFGNTPLTLIYREANNPYADRLINRLRASRCDGMFPKGPRGAVKMVRALKSGRSLAMLVDQKMNDGIAVPFFGRDAMTAPAIAELALRYDRPIIPARVVRTGGAHFEGTVYPPLAIEKTGDNAKDTLAIMTQINAMLEGWIREYPEQWFWVHQRWPK